jgi:acetyl-CoA acetyltransferase
MTHALIVSTARTPLAKSWKGSFNMTHGATLGGHVVKAAVERAGIDPGAVEDVLLGCANPEGATGWNIARQAARVCKRSRWRRSASSPARVTCTWPAASRASRACSRR